MRSLIRSSAPQAGSSAATGRLVLMAGAAALLLAACAETAPPSASPQSAAPAAQAKAAAPATINVPAGRYRHDPSHATLEFRVSHLGLADYVARFADFEISAQLDPDDHAGSSVEVTLDPASVRTGHPPADYQATHEDSPYQSFDEDLAQSPKFFNAGEYPQITFRSTRVEQTAPDTLRVSGDLSMLGQTHPVTLQAVVTGSAAAHPFHKRGALGLTVTGSFRRSDFGMTHLLKPPLVGDEVKLRFDGELHQVKDADA